MCLVTRGHFRSNRKKGKNWTYLDDIGGRWAGLVCPDCHKANQRDYCKRKAVTATPRARPELGSVEPLYVGRIKLCPSCGLNTINYYKCQACTSHNQAAYFMEAMGGVAY